MALDALLSSRSRARCSSIHWCTSSRHRTRRTDADGCGGRASAERARFRASPCNRSRRSGAAGGGQRINQEIAVELLEASGAVVTVANNGREAVELLA